MTVPYIDTCELGGGTQWLGSRDGAGAQLTHDWEEEDDNDENEEDDNDADDDNEDNENPAYCSVLVFPEPTQCRWT